MAAYQNLFMFVAGFTLIALASKQIGQLFARFKLPLISGFLFAGIIAGPFIFDFISVEATERLRFVDELSLAFIAFVAGSELYLKELRSRFKSIKLVSISIVLSTFILGSLTVFVLADFIPFMRELPVPSRIAIAILAGAILVARSPSSAVAIIKELRAKGPFTQTVMGVTVVMDVLVIILFSVNSSIADALLTGLRFNLTFIMLLFVELTAALAGGYVVGRILQQILSSRINHIAKIVGILLTGYAVFAVFAGIRHFTHDRLPFEVFVEPLLVCMIGGFWLINATDFRDEFLKTLHEVGPLIYIAFFTLTGASLTLDILADIWPITLLLVAVRLAVIFIGSFTGGVLAGDPMTYNKVSWMAYITQAGVGLGLAKEAGGTFPAWGPAFATLMISIIVVNQIVGPAFFKWALGWVKEARPRAKKSEPDQIHSTIIFGSDSQSLALARQLRAHDWEVKVAYRQTDEIKNVTNSYFDVQPMPGFSLNELQAFGVGEAGAVVAMLSDEENYRICELACEHFETDNLVVRLNDLANYDRFRELGAFTVRPSTAIISLLDHFVRAPSSVSLLLGMEENHDIIDLEISNPNLAGMAVRDLRLPSDALILSVRRAGHIIITHGYTELQIGDWVTVVGSLESLEELELRFGEYSSALHTTYPPRHELALGKDTAG
jgi:Trk K+ transport system NAD-binding subunit/Kef-type K+ transport system membrane component KefB